jgi:hypothetical protein
VTVRGGHLVIGRTDEYGADPSLSTSQNRQPIQDRVLGHG